MSNPKENNSLPSPENPNNGFSIEVENPSQIYSYVTEGKYFYKYDQYAHKIKNFLDFYSEDNLGDRSNIEDGIIDHIDVSIYGTDEKFIRPTSNIEYNFFFVATIDKQISTKLKSPKCYFSSTEIENLTEKLKILGLNSKSYNNEGTNIVKVNNKECLSFIVNLGSVGLEEHAKKLNYNEEDIKKILNEEQIPHRPGSLTLRNTFVYIYMDGQINKSILPGDNLVLLTNENEFKKNINSFAEVAQKTITALYSICGIKEPNTKIILKAPIIKEDRKEKETNFFIPRTVDKKSIDSFDSIAGQSRAVVEAKKLVLAINHPEVYEKRGVKTPKGILFYGPPGTGKTLIAKAIASEVNAELFEVSFSDIGSKWYGESEKRIQEIFDQANNVTKTGKKAIILFDELDSMAPSRIDSYEGSKKIVSIILQNLDGFRSNKNVLIIGTTNRPEDIDPALKRPGRIDKIIPVDLPDLNDRKAILELHINKAKESASESHDLFSSDLDIQKIAENTENMSGADLANIINLTLETKTVLELEGLRWTPISNTDIERTLVEFNLKKKEKNRIGFQA